MGQRRRPNLCSQQGFLIFPSEGDRASRRLPHPGEEPQGAPRPRYTHVHRDNVTHTTREYLLYKYIEHTTST